MSHWACKFNIPIDYHQGPHDLVLTHSNEKSRLAHCGTPMVLAAIDVKLSSSFSNMIEREQSLGHCTQIVNQSRGIYDVTDFFLQGTNQVLHLAYAITKNLFLESNSQRRTSSDAKSADHFDGTLDSRHENNRALAPTFEGLRVKSWVDAFLKYPRAYLLLSTCIDRSLATGRLPRDDALPSLVRSTLWVVLGHPQLPWTISTPRQGHVTKNRECIEDGHRSPGSLSRTRHSALDDPWSWTLLRTPSPGSNLFETDMTRAHNQDNQDTVDGTADPLESGVELARPFAADPNDILCAFNSIAGV